MSVLLSTFYLSLYPFNQNNSTGLSVDCPGHFSFEISARQASLDREPYGHLQSALPELVNVAGRCTLGWKTSLTSCSCMGERWVGREWTLSFKVPFVLLTLSDIFLRSFLPAWPETVGCWDCLPCSLRTLYLWLCTIAPSEPVKILCYFISKEFFFQTDLIPALAFCETRWFASLILDAVKLSWASVFLCS